jgi:hypothetical protein
LRRGSSEGSTGSGPTADPTATTSTPPTPPQQEQQHTADSESITLSDDSLNELDEYQSPYILQSTANRLHLTVPENEDDMVDSLQPPVRQQRAPLYPDSLNHPNGLFDSMEEEEEGVGVVGRVGRRLIQPYLDNSLSTGSYTSEQEEEEEQEVNRVQQQLQLHNNINMKVFL